MSTGSYTRTACLIMGVRIVAEDRSIVASGKSGGLIKRARRRVDERRTEEGGEEDGVRSSTWLSVGAVSCCG